MAVTEEARAARMAEAQEARAGRILDAARAVLAANGTSGLTMRAVAGEAGYTAGAVYSYFPSKEALLAALARDELDALAHEMKDGGDLGALNGRAVTALRRVVPLLTAARRGDVPAETERALTGRIIRILRMLDGAAGTDTPSDTLALWAGLVGIALLSWSGRFESLGVSEDDVAAALTARFA